MDIPGLAYFPNFITDMQQEHIVASIDNHRWSNELKRRVQHYGYKYDYKKRAINESMKVCDLLPWMKVYGQKFVDCNLFPKMPDQAIVNEYERGQGINRHIDCEPCFQNAIASLSLLSSCIMQFTRNDKLVELYLEPKSLLVINGEARYHWYHGIPARWADAGISRSRRISVTFRNVILEGELND